MVDNPAFAPLVTLAHDLPWQELMPGVARRTLWATPASGSAPSREMSMVRYDAGARVPLHRHVHGDEIVFVIEGHLSDEYGVITAGNVGYRPDGCVHSLHSENGGTTLSYLVGGGEMISDQPADSPPSQIVSVCEMPWSQRQDGRFAFKPIWNDPGTGRQFILAKFPSGTVLPPNGIAGESLIFQIEGTFGHEAGPLLPGHMGYRPADSRQPLFSEHGSLSLIYIWGKGK